MSERYWQVQNNGIRWDVKEGTVHKDNVEMSGLYLDYLVAISADC